MIPSGLKVGDKFIDENREFVVLETNEQGYVSRFVGFVDSSTLPTVETVTKEKTEGKQPDYENIGIRELQKICKDKGLTVRGSKSELVERLKSAV